MILLLYQIRFSNIIGSLNALWSIDFGFLAGHTGDPLLFHFWQSRAKLAMKEILTQSNPSSCYKAIKATWNRCRIPTFLYISLWWLFHNISRGAIHNWLWNKIEKICHSNFIHRIHHIMTQLKTKENKGQKNVAISVCGTIDY